MKRTLPSDWKNCGTCKNWTGKKTADISGKKILFDDQDREMCPIEKFRAKGDHPGCNKWAPAFK